jgi:hypothetical protein
VVRVRAWVTPSKPGAGLVEIETVFRPVADPSVPERELEAPVPGEHPFAVRVVRLVEALVARFGEPTDSAGVPRSVVPTAAPPPVPADTPATPPRPAATPVRPDTTPVRPDTTPVRPDATPVRSVPTPVRPETAPVRPGTASP